jgi:hypothetical protein
MRSLGKSRCPQVAELALAGRCIGLVIIDEWFDMVLGEELALVPREGGLFGREQPVVVQFDKSTMADSAVVPRRSTRPWLRARKGRSRQ